MMHLPHSAAHTCSVCIQAPQWNACTTSGVAFLCLVFSVSDARVALSAVLIACTGAMRPQAVQHMGSPTYPLAYPPMLHGQVEYGGGYFPQVLLPRAVTAL